MYHGNVPVLDIKGTGDTYLDGSLTLGLDSSTIAPTLSTDVNGDFIITLK